MAFKISAKDKNGRTEGKTPDERDERSCIEALLDCSDRTESFFETVSCDDWAEAAVGWKPTVPNPKFIHTRDPPSKKRKDDDHHRSPYEDTPFKNRPDTHYRYTTKTKIQPKSLKQISEISVPKKPADVGLQDHINRVKEHLEIALRTKEQYDDTGMKKQLNDKFVHEFLENLTEQLHTDTNGADGGDQFTGPYRIKLDATATSDSDDKLNQQAGAQQKPDYKGETKMQGNKKGMEPPKNGLELIVENTRTESIHQLCNKHKGGKSEKEMNLLDRINKKLDETLAEQDQYTVSLKKKSSFHSHAAERLTSRSYEKFPAFTILPVEQTDLRPLRKLTPSQRRALDDHVIAAKMAQEHELEGRAQITSAPLLTHSSSVSSFTSERSQSDSPNKNFMTKGINGKSLKVPPVIKSSPYAQQSKDSKKKVNVRPRKVASIASPYNSEGLTPRSLGEHALFQSTDNDLNKATAPIAAELLPGVDGRKMTLPLVTQRLL